MTIPFAITDDIQESPIVYFLQHYQECIFHKMNKIKDLQVNKIICIKHNANKIDCLKAINSFNLSKYYTNIFLVPKKIIMPDLSHQYNLVNYPIKYLDFNKIIQSLLRQTAKSFKKLYLSSGSILVNKENNKKVFMTETEMKILAILFDKIIVKKDFLRQSILNFQPGIETRSLESHLSRIRKKIHEIEGVTDIVSKDSIFIAIY